MTDDFDDRLPIGRRILWMVIVWIVLLSLGSFAYTIREAAPSKIARTSFRVLLTLFLCYKLSRGRNWARLTLGILSALAVLVGLVGFRPVFENGSVTAILLASPFLLLPAFNAWALLYSRSLRDYLLWRRTHQIRSRRGEISQLVNRLDQHRQGETPFTPDD